MCYNRCRYAHSYTGECTYKGKHAPCDMVDDYDEDAEDVALINNIVGEACFMAAEERRIALAEAMAKIEQGYGDCYARA